MRRISQLPRDFRKTGALRELTSFLSISRHQCCSPILSQFQCLQRSIQFRFHSVLRNVSLDAVCDRPFTVFAERKQNTGSRIYQYEPKKKSAPCWNANAVPTGNFRWRNFMLLIWKCFCGTTRHRIWRDKLVQRPHVHLHKRGLRACTCVASIRTKPRKRNTNPDPRECVCFNIDVEVLSNHHRWMSLTSTT